MGNHFSTSASTAFRLIIVGALVAACTDQQDPMVVGDRSFAAAGPVTSVQVSPDPVQVAVGGTANLTATALAADGSVVTGLPVTWQTLNRYRVTIDNTGKVTGLDGGVWHVTATIDGVADTSSVHVLHPVPVLSAISPAGARAGSPEIVITVTASGMGIGAQLSFAGQMLRLVQYDVNRAWAKVPATLLAKDATVDVRVVNPSPGGGASNGLTFTVGNGGPAPSPAPVASVTVTPTSGSAQVGQTLQFTATTRDSAGNVLTGRAVSWTSSDSSAAVVNSAGLVMAVGVGKATITATSEGKSGTASFTATAPPGQAPVATVTVAPSSDTAQVGQSVQYTATTRDSLGNVMTGRTISWTSSNTSVGVVNSNGLVMAVGAGTATITATSEGKSGTGSFTATAPPPAPVASVTISPGSASVQTGGSVQFTATMRDANGNVLTGRMVAWASSDTSRATVNASGLATARNAGTVTITATSEGRSGTAQLSITAPPPPPTGQCEAIAPARCYHIGLNGNDANAGTATAPFATFAKAHSVAAAGDFIYYLPGTYTDDARHFINYSKNLNGAGGQRITIKPLPGANVIFDNMGRDGSLAYLGGLGAIVEGFEFRNSRYGGPRGAIQGWTQGISIWGRFIHFRRNYVHDITGYSNGNGGSLRIQDTSNNEVYNNYFDRLFVGGTGASHNVNHVIVMDGLNNRIYHNYFAGSAAGCFLQKHNPRAGNQASVFNNMFINCARSGVNIQGFGYTVHHNLFVNSTLNYDYTGAYNNIFEYNTIYSSAQSLIVGTSQPNTIRRNILYQTATTFDTGNGRYTMRINHYGGDSDFQAGLSGDVIDFNCYFNPNLAVRFSYYGGSPTSSGGVYTLAQFKGIGKDVNSVEANPLFVNAAGNDFRTASGSACSNMGAYAASSGGGPPVTPAAALGRIP